MVTLVPGFQLEEGNAAIRGYAGSTGNVVIDGKPPASKQDKLEDILKRIPASSVERLELLRPGAAGIDMQGKPLLINVVQKVSALPHGQVEAETAFYRHGISAPRMAGQIVMGTSSVIDISGAWYHEPEWDWGFGQRNRYAANGTVLRLARYDQPRVNTFWLLTGNYRQPLLGGNIRLNGLYNQESSNTFSVEHRYFPALVDLDGRDYQFNSIIETGLEYSRPLWTDAETEVIALRRGKSQRANQQSNTGDSDTLATRITDSAETILRIVGRQRSGSVTLEAGAEGTLNTLSNNSSLKVDGIATPLPVAMVRIREERAEFFVNSTWQARPNLVLEASLHYEMSQLNQSGNSVLNRWLAFWKPRARVSWAATSEDDLRLTYEREVGQLDFNNFVSTVQVNTGTVTSGNKNRAPYTLWRSSIAWEHRRASGSVVLSARHEEISDTVDRLAVITPEGIYDSVGNIGPGHRDELQLDLIMPLDWLPLPGFSFQGTGTYRTSSVSDPVTGTSRRISNDAPMDGKATLTQDLPDWNLKWGVTYQNDSDKSQYRFNEIIRDHMFPRVEAFVEFKPAPKWLIRVFGKNLSDTPVIRSRLNYLGPRNNSGVDFYDERRPNFGPSLGISFQRTF